MYSMVLVMSMAGAPEVPQFGWHKGGCTGYAPVASQSYSSGCYGGGGGHGCCLFGKLKSCFSGFGHKSGGCYGGGYNGGNNGGVIYSEAAPGCGTVVIPPPHGTVVPGTVVPGTVVPDMKDMKKDMPKPIDPKPGVPKIG